jgi:hypothetical protein
MTTSQDVWLKVFVATVNTQGEERAARIADRACGEFEKKFDKSYEASIAKIAALKPPVVEDKK